MKKNTITKGMIDKIIDNSKIEKFEVFDKCTVVAMKLPNGFVLVESSACVDPANFDMDMGYRLCMKKLTDKLWELEGYVLQNKIHKEAQPERDINDMTIGELIDRKFNVVFEMLNANDSRVILTDERR